MKNYFFAVFLIMALVAGILQIYGLQIFGVQPGFLLVFASLVPFFTMRASEGIFFILLASLFFKFSPSATAEVFVFFALASVFFMAKKLLPLNFLATCIIFCFVFTFAFYAIFSPGLIFSWLFVKEVFFNCVLTLAAFTFLSFFKKDVQ